MTVFLLPFLAPPSLRETTEGALTFGADADTDLDGEEETAVTGIELGTSGSANDELRTVPRVARGRPRRIQTTVKNPSPEVPSYTPAPSKANPDCNE